MNNGKQSEQLLNVLGGHSASLDRTSKCRGLSEQPLYSGGHKAMQHETRNWNNFDKCEPEQQYRLGTVRNPQVCDNHRGISLLSFAGKILANIMLNRLNVHLDQKGLISESQCGFRND